LRHRHERRIGNALTAQNLYRPDQTFGNALTKPATLAPLNAIAPLFRALEIHGQIGASLNQTPQSQASNLI
jgi:hypothetical protein